MALEQQTGSAVSTIQYIGARVQNEAGKQVSQLKCEVYAEKVENNFNSMRVAHQPIHSKPQQAAVAPLFSNAVPQFGALRAAR